jgi:hypothetical protein
MTRWIDWTAAVGVQRAHAEVTRLADGQCGLDRLQIAHLADQHDVRILPQDVFQRRLEVDRVAADLALVDDASSCAGAGTRSGPRS